MKHLLLIDRKLDAVSRRISFGLINPINLETERERFFSVSGYNPLFEYAPSGDSLTQLKAELESLAPDQSIIGNTLSDIRDMYLRDIEMIDTRGTDAFTAASLRMYGAPDHTLVLKAQHLASLTPEPERQGYSTEEVLRRLRVAFVRYGFPWQVKEHNMVASAAVKPASRQLLIRRNSRFSDKFLKRIIVHEIGTHIMRAENGASQPFTFMSRGLPGYLPTEEGLAVFNEEMHDCLNPSVLKIYAGRVLAVHYALKSSFRDTYLALRESFNRDTAWRLAVRAKRGLHDTSRPGAYTKDICYLQGYLQVKSYVSRGGSLSRLYYGKLGLQHLSLLDKIPGLFHPGLLPMFRYLRFFSGHFGSIAKRIIILDSLQHLSLPAKY